MLSNYYFLAKFRFDTAENEPAKDLQLIARFANFAPATLARCDAAQAAMRTTQMLPSIAKGQGPHLLLGAPYPSRADYPILQILEKCRQDLARFRLYRHRSLQVNTRFEAFFKIDQIIELTFLKFGKNN